MRQYLKDLVEKVTMQIAWWMPKTICGWCAIRVWAHGTQGKWANQEVPALTCVEALERWGEQ